VADTERFERLLHQAVDEFDLDMFLETPRKLECFAGEISSGMACSAASPDTCY
jgi:hypothetical protein